MCGAGPMTRPSTSKSATAAPRELSAVAPASSEDDVGGFGLELVAHLASDWGVERDRHGTTVWLKLPAALEAPS